MTGALEVVRAGAGSGKTTDLCQTVADAVVAGLDPARILATTFTKKAAAELKSRIQSKLLTSGGDAQLAHRQADRLELAAIGTVHSVAHQLLRRYAIELGLSPRLEVIEEAGADRVLRELLGSITLDAWQPLVELAQRLDVDELPKHFLNLLAIKRGNCISDRDFLAHMSASAEQVCQLLSPAGPVAEGPPHDRLRELAAEALARLEALVEDQQKNTNDARHKLRLLSSRRSPNWGSYLDASRISAGRRFGADALLEELRSHAAIVRRHPQLHDDIRRFSALLAAETVRLQEHYIATKAQRGLVDFTDLEVMFLDLLRHPELSKRLQQDFDLALVDEFQDTSPLQLAIFQRLRSLLPRSRWVGDPKQAIYGFRDTDPQLVHAVWQRTARRERKHLPNNHRSQRGLVQLIGALFVQGLGEDARQIPVRAAEPRGVERWLLDAKNQSDDAMALACGIAQLQAEGSRLGDIAVLARKNDSLAQLAAALDQLGVAYLLESPGLFRTREGALLLAGVRLVADRNDSLAAATIHHLLGSPTEKTPAWIIERLEEVREVERRQARRPEAAYALPWQGDERLLPLERIDATLCSPWHVVQQVIEALELPRRIHAWGAPASRCANLDSALLHAREYEEQGLRSGSAVTLSGLILYWERLASLGNDMRFTSQGHDAVTLTTFHSAKGLEWPIVILSGLHKTRAADLWQPVVSGGGIDPEDPLRGRTLRCWVWPFGRSEGRSGGLRTGSDLEADALDSPEGRQRKARDAEESLRLLYVGCTRAREKLVFAHRPGQCDWLEQLPELKAILPDDAEPGEHPLSGFETTYVLRRLSAEMFDECQIAAPREACWLAPPRRPRGRAAKEPTGRRVERFHSPSAAEAQAIDPPSAWTRLSDEFVFPEGLDDVTLAAVGYAVHSYLAALPSLQGLEARDRSQVAERCLVAYGVVEKLHPATLVESGEHLQRWVESTFPGARWHVEVPVSGPRAAGGQWVGTVDLVLELSDGRLVIVDHKSAPIRRQQCPKKAAQYSGQLASYCEILSAAPATIHSCWIHFPLAGTIVQLSADGE
jgi:ATP-dependent exoDNAse (exonuclease V) beta subunit